jgi:hypothetical protein
VDWSAHLPRSVASFFISLTLQAHDQELSDRDSTFTPLSDVLPGGTTITWSNGVRPAWFLRQQAATSDSKPCSERSRSRIPDIEAVDLDPTNTRALTSTQANACLKAARKILRKCGGTCKLQMLAEKVVISVERTGGAPGGQKALKKRVKRFLKGSDGWLVQDGVVSKAGL